MTEHDPTRVPLGTLITWGNGYGMGTVVGCYRSPEVPDPTAINGFVVELGLDPVTAPEDYTGYVIMRSNESQHIPSPMMGAGIFVFREFDDVGGKFHFNNCHRDVREAH